MRRRLPALLVAALALVACSDDGGPVVAPDDALPDVPDPLDVPGASAGEDADAAGPDVPEADIPEEPPEPPKLLLTIDAIPGEMNGSVPARFTSGAEAAFRIHVNAADFTLDALPAPGSGPIAWDTLAITCDADLADQDGALLEPDVPFGVEALEPTPDGEGWRLHVGPGAGLPHGLEVTCAATADGPAGQTESVIAFVVEDLPPHLDPFVEPDVWLVVLSRDIFQIGAEPNDDGSWWVYSDHVPEGDGVLDFDEAFLLMGIFSEDHPEATAVVKQWLLDVIRAHAYRIFQLDEVGAPTPEGVPLHLYFEGDPGAPPADEWDGTFSRIAVGGDGTPEDQVNGIVGRATIDWNNQGHEDDAAYGLGVYPSAIVRQVLGNPLGALILETLMPQVGDPIGSLPIDDVILAPDFDPETYPDLDAVDRYTILQFAVEMGGLAVASTLCHEMGHSLGLVPYGLPPGGLFASLNGLVFTDNDVPSAHIDTPGLNVMQTGAVTNWAEALGQQPEFNALNMAYLRRRLVVK